MSIKTKRRLGHICLWLSIFCALAIWRFSLEDGTLSGARSTAIMQMLRRLFSEIIPQRGELLLRKAAHFSEYAALGGILTFALLCFNKGSLRYSPYVLLPCLLCAVIDETIQIFTPGRTSSTIDVLIDFAGATIGMLLVLSLFALIKPKKRRHRKNANR